VGGGAAGLATAIFAARRNPRLQVVVLDGAGRLGAKILISGGGRCNVTNRDVVPSDYWGGSRQVVASVLRAFPASRAPGFFLELGVPLHEEERGKLFPDSNRARTVLDAMLGELERLRVSIHTGWRVTGLAPDAEAGWRVTRAEGELLQARRVVLATGGLSLPKTGSDGGGLAIAASLGHTIVQTTAALVPLVLAGDFHPPLSGVSHDAAIAIEAGGKAVARLHGPMLWTHFGISGPAALDASRHWLRAVTEGCEATARLSFVPGLDFGAAERAFIDAAAEGGRSSTVRSVMGTWLPAAVSDRLLGVLGLDGSTRLAQLARDDRRRLAHALTAWQLPIKASRGYNYAEATAGGVSLDEVDRHTLESRKCPGLHLVGEMLDVDGRLGGFNFQWAWATGWVAGDAIGRELT
jgi:predicted Rossmann fold flavoprotein